MILFDLNVRSRTRLPVVEAHPDHWIDCAIINIPTLYVATVHICGLVQDSNHILLPTDKRLYFLKLFFLVFLEFHVYNGSLINIYLWI